MPLAFAKRKFTAMTIVRKKWNQFVKWLSHVTGFDGLDEVVPSLLGSIAGTNMTGRDTQLAETQLNNQRLLNEEDYQRKIDFYERFESPEAQVAQYKNAGLNPALMYGNGASVSASGGIGAGSASAPSAGTDAASVLGSILGFVNNMKRMKQERDIYDDQRELRKFDLETQRRSVDNYGRLLAAQTIGQQNVNDTFYTLFGKRLDAMEADINLKNQQAEYFVQVAQSEPVRRRLMESGIKLNDASAACQQVQKAILEAQEKYSDRYFKAVADFQEAASRMQNIDADNYEQLQKEGYLYKAALSNLANIVMDAGMKYDIWTGEAWQKAIDGKMTKKDWTETTFSVLKSLIAGAAIVGVGYMRVAAAGVTPPAIPWSNPSYSVNPSAPVM